MKHFLLFQLKSVCYDSYAYFSDSVAKELRTAGHSAEIFSLAKEPLEAAERFTGKTFDAVLDFNSDLPKLRMEDGSYYLDQIDAPFYDVILDHPLYHHDMLKQKIHNFHVLCLDENHKRYIECCYPHIASVHVWAMTGEDAGQRRETWCERNAVSGRDAISGQDTGAGQEIIPGLDGYPQKDIDLLFPGTYTDYRQVEASIRSCPPFLGDMTRRLIGLMQEEPSLTQEAALARLLPSLDEELLMPSLGELVEENFPLHMQATFLCDTWLRAWRRERLLTALAGEGLPLTLCGNGWQNSPLADFPRVKIIPDTAFYETFSLFRRAKILLNLMPGFLNGTHDRIYSAMLNHSLCLTDATPLLRSQFAEDREILFYDVENWDVQNLKDLASRITGLLADPKRIEAIAQAGYRKAKKSHTWQARVADFLAFL